ncbi:hypothetical protein F4556_005201 [Kitasatospora gansuensis]|uniref:Uncharacterized protein n=1 Tax=Kitasatospora gansuensis TaxID=258050 RepID=A0A7W7WJU4_9ACTN|nr:hypothetical protein [Kitasatospora gansuensis]MBB4949666.1 hypothetical protein [Kitasatospora gansuensis]
MSNNALEAATLEYTKSEEALQELHRSHPNGTLTPALAEPLERRNKVARERYAAELKKAGHAVPGGLLGH